MENYTATQQSSKGDSESGISLLEKEVARLIRHARTGDSFPSEDPAGWNQSQGNRAAPASAQYAPLSAHVPASSGTLPAPDVFAPEDLS